MLRELATPCQHSSHKRRMQRFMHLSIVQWIGLEIQTKTKLCRVEERNACMYYLEVYFNQIKGESVMDQKDMSA